jgi:hypothetical protein
MDKVHKATIKETNETINVYKLNNGNYYDYDNMGEHQPPSAILAKKKEFKPNELIIQS